MAKIRVAQTEITSIHRHGFWLRWHEEELYLPFALFPWFEHATVGQLFRVEAVGAACVYWPALDVELAVDRIRQPMAAAQLAGNKDC
jgi:hypothetical protein